MTDDLLDDPTDPATRNPRLAGPAATTGTAAQPLPAAPVQAEPIPASTATLFVTAAIGGAVALALGTYAKVHTPTYQGIVAFGFPAVLPMKAWFTTFAAVLALGQLGSAMWMYGRLPGVGSPPKWIGAGHRWLGTAAFLFTLPVAYHCLWALGFQSTDARVLAHSVLGCIFYGAFTSKMLILRSDRMPKWALPSAGGLLFAVLVAIWMTSSLWFFTTVGFPGV